MFDINEMLEVSYCKLKIIGDLPIVARDCYSNSKKSCEKKTR